MSLIAEILIAVLLLFGASFALIGSWGLAKLPDFFTRLHGPTKATTLGIGATLAASVVYFSFRTDELSLHEILVALFLFMTAPVSAHLLAKSAVHLRLPSHRTQPPESWRRQE